MFSPFLGQTASEILQLIGEAETLESKRKVAGFLTTIIERAGKTVSLFQFESAFYLKTSSLKQYLLDHTCCWRHHFNLTSTLCAFSLRADLTTC